MQEFFAKPFQLHGVEGRVTARVFPARCRRIVAGLVLGWVVGAGLGPGVRAAVQEGTGPLMAPATEESAGGAAKPMLDELVYHDGDRVRGRFVEQVGETIVFQSERFGLLHVAAKEAEVILAQMPDPEVVPVVEESERVPLTVERGPFSPRAVARELKEFFGSWHGRFNVGAEALNNTRDQSSVTVEARLQRKWKRDEAQMNLRYDYSALENVTSTDMVRGDAVWRHDFPKRFFAVYRPALEWNRAYFRSGVPADYVLLQQEIGAGINLFNVPTRKLRAGVSENMFDTWLTSEGEHVAQTVESVFAEFEAKLPWRITLTNRGIWYYSISDNTDGWENRFEISQKLTETLTIGARHEIRYNNPDVRVSDYERLRVLFGFDF